MLVVAKGARQKRGGDDLPPRKHFQPLMTIRIERAVVVTVGKAVVVIIKVTTIAYAVTIRVTLVLIRCERAVVLSIRYAVVVVVVVTTIADAVVI